jgi:uncharacterized protein (TIGR03000 family)
MALAGNASAQNRPKGSGSGEQREGASNAGRQESGERREGEQRREGASTGERRESGTRVEGEARGGYYYGPSGGRGIYGPGYNTFSGPRYYYRYGYPGYYGNGMYYGSDFDNTYSSGDFSGSGYYDDGSSAGRRGRFFGRRRGGNDYNYGSYGSSSGCHGGCHGSSYGSGCHGSSGYYGAPTGDSAYNYGSLGNAALINVKVAQNATLTFDDEPTQQTGEFRQFMTPALEPGKNFSYTVHAKWQDGGRDMDQSRKVSVRAGQQTQVDFNTAQAQDSKASPEPAPQPAQGRQPSEAKEPSPAPLPAASDRNAPQAAASESHEGTVISFKDGTLEMNDPQHGKHSHHLSADTQVMIDDRPAKPEDLKADMKIKVTAKKNDSQTITKIEAKSKDSGDKGISNKETPPPPQP